MGIRGSRVDSSNAINAELWCRLFQPEQTLEQVVDLPLLFYDGTHETSL